MKNSNKDWRTYWQGYGLVTVLFVLIVMLALLVPSFHSPQNWLILLRQISINAILAVGVTYVLLSGGVDLSLGSVLALAGVVAALVARHPALGAFAAAFAGIGVGLACGWVSGTVVTWGRVAPFIVTLGMMAAARGLALVLSGGRPVAGLPEAFTWMGSGTVLGLHVPVCVLLVVAVATHVGLRFTRPGRHLYATGGNPEAARAAGIRVERVRLAAYSVCGGLAGLAGVLLAARMTVGQPNAGVAYELDAIAAAVIGGTSLSGGVGGVGGTLLGAVLMGVITSGLDQLNVSSYYQQIVKGILIVGAVWLDQRQRPSTSRLP